MPRRARSGASTTIHRGTRLVSRSSPGGRFSGSPSWVRPRQLDRPGRRPPAGPRDNANQVACTQVRALVERLPAGQAPLFVFDAGYDPVQLGQGLAGSGAAILVRLRTALFCGDPPPAPPGRTGRPRRHGAKLDTDAPTNWPAPTAAHVSDDGQFGTVMVCAWDGLHPKQQLHPTRGTKRSRPIVRGTLIRVQVSVIPARTRPPKVLWRAYVRRFDLEHTIRFYSRPSARPPQGCGIPSRPTDGPGWSWPPTPSSASPEPASPTSGCHGNGTCPAPG
jgi:hypothetical protein